MPRRKLPYKEGDWIAVPLREGGYALGVVARMDGRGGVLGYFFGSRFSQVPTYDAISTKRPEEAVLICRFGDLGLITGRWPVLGGSLQWNRDEWPIPHFRRGSILTNRVFRVVYHDSSFTSPVSDEPAPPEEVAGLPEDSLFGSGAVEIRLTFLLGKPH